ncbi:hypothetical protein LCGC14_0254130 [marine sediment metagenome]|uniref:SMP-30/Gluconolactonase/LRE-like region domain-containing protein n=1 Tax=marine sediment metagenome TaxID=412755 RepID=A0A0F9UKK6_9ZZZZ|nr:hypothetical protein [Phycisphaerae bacterium]HDZ45107.1 hypothetical protein [Phycisphaerae bacterium]
MRRYASITGRIIVLLALVFLVGCGEETPEISQAIFYPPAPDLPRLQFLLSFSDLEQWSHRKSSFADFIVGSEVSSAGEITSPYGVAARNGKIYICDIARGRVHVIDVAAKTHGQLGDASNIRKPVNITIDTDGTKYVCDTMAERVVVFDADDQFVRFIDNGATCNPIDLVVDGDELIVADVADAEVEAWSRDGKFLRLIAKNGKGPGELRDPRNLAIDSKGRIFVSDTVASIINIYNRRGQFIGYIGAPGDRPGFFARPKGIAIDPDDIIYTADAQWEIVQLFEPEGRLLMFFGGAAAGPEGMGMPAGLAIDTTSIDAFADYIDEDFEAEYLLFVANQFGKNKIGVYAFGKSKSATYPPMIKRTATKPPSPKSGTRAPSTPGTRSD